jgi:hypothetical protein
VTSEWTMPRRADACCVCRREFKVGETFQACLYEAPEGYERRDYCTACPPPPEPPPLGVWRTRRPEPSARRNLPFDREAVYAFFERFEDAPGGQPAQFRFVLALLLWRKKALKLDRTVDTDAGEVWEFTALKTNTVHRVLRPELDEAQLERLSGQLEQLLAGQPGELDQLGEHLGKEPPDA